MLTGHQKSSVQWMAPAPLWSDAAFKGSLLHLQRPLLLRFRSDTFFKDFLALVQQQPAQIKSYIAKAETFRTLPLPQVLGALANVLAPVPSQVKLYLPVQGCFYLLVASLVANVSNLPDHPVSRQQGEKTRFVLRRLTPAGQEMAWMSDPAALPPTKFSWRVLSGEEQTRAVANEALLPLFPVTYSDGEQGVKRRLLVGSVPTTSSETSTTEGKMQPKIDPTGKASYVLRCIYSRSAAGQDGAALVSDPTERFQIATMTDSDAPTRPIHLPGVPDAIASALEKLHL